MMMSLSGALQSIPREMYEAAEVDGVSHWDQFRHLTMPNLKSALIPLSLLGFIWTFNMFNVIYLMTDGGPNLTYGPGSTDILITPKRGTTHSGKIKSLDSTSTSVGTGNEKFQR